MKSFWRFLKRDFIRKLVALVLAVMFYFGISARITVEKQLIDVPVQIVLSKELYGERLQYSTNILVRGPERVLNELSPSEISGRVEVNESNHLRDGVYEVNLSPSDFSLPNGVKIVRCGKLNVKLQKMVSRKLRVEPKYSGRLSEEYSITDTRVIPSEVEASGPESLLTQLEFVSTGPVPLSSELVDSFGYTAEVPSPSSAIMLSPQQVIVETMISRKMATREFKKLPVLLGNSGGNELKFEFTKSGTVDVIASGLTQRIEELTAADITAIVDVSQITSPGLMALPVICTVKIDGVSVRKVYPAELEIKVTKNK